MIPIILAGGSGERLWPQSSRKVPKQFHHLFGDDLTMFQRTLLRAAKVTVERPLVIANHMHMDLALRQAKQVGIEIDLLMEAVPCGTAMSVAIATVSEFLKLCEDKTKADTRMLVLPSDHHVENEDSWVDTVGGVDAMDLAYAGKIVLFGIQPTVPDTQFGYIGVGKRIDDRQAYVVEKFVEKPRLSDAREMIEDNFLWNSGMFMGTARSFRQEFRTRVPALLAEAEYAYYWKSHVGHDSYILRTEKSGIEKTSLDYALMEGCTNLAVVDITPSGWDDVGTWDKVMKAMHTTDTGTCTPRENLAAVLDSHNSFVRNTTERPVVMIGANDLIVVQTEEGTLIVHKESSHLLKQALQQIERKT